MALPTTRVVLDTDMGNDIDDALALAMLHNLSSLGECEIVGIASSKDNPWSTAYIELVNRYYGRADIPLAAVRGGATHADGSFTRRSVLAAREAGPAPRHGPPSRDPAPAPDADRQLRRWLAEADDRSLVVVTIGFFTNIARLLKDDGPQGRDLFARKVKWVCSMAGDFSGEGPARPDGEGAEYNIKMDLEAARVFVECCPVPVVWSGFEVGLNVPFPVNDFARECRRGGDDGNPVLEGYRFFHQHFDPAWRPDEPMTHRRPTWDLTAVLHAVRPQAGYFEPSPPGEVRLEEDGATLFIPRQNGRDRYLRLGGGEAVERLQRDFVALCAPPLRQPAMR